MSQKRNQRTTRRILITGGLWGNFSSLVPIAGAVVLTPYLIHGFGVKRWGLYVFISAVSSFFGPLGGGIGPAVGRFFSIHAASGDKARLTETFWTVCLIVAVIGAVVTVVTWLLAPPLLALFGAHSSTAEGGVFLFRTAGVLLAATLLQNVFSALFASHQAYAFSNVLSVAAYTVWAGLMVMSVRGGYGLRGAAVALIAQQGVCLLVLAPASVRYLSRRPGLLPWIEIKQFVWFAASSQGMTFVGLVNEQLDGLLVGSFFNLTSLTYFNSGANFAMQSRGIAYNFLGPPGTYLARSYGRGGEGAAFADFPVLQRIWVQGIIGWSTVTLGASYFAVVAWLGPQFSLAGEVAAIFMMGNAVNLCTGMLTQYLSAIGRPDLEVRYGVFSAIINIALTIPAIFIGPLAVAGTTALGSLLGSLYLVRIVHNNGFRRHKYGRGQHSRRGYGQALQVPSYLGDIPYGAALGAGAVTVGLELAIRPLHVGGPPGLLFCGIPALVGLGCYAALVFRGRLVHLLRLLQSHRVGSDTVLAAVSRLMIDSEQAPC